MGKHCSGDPQAWSGPRLGPLLAGVGLPHPCALREFLQLSWPSVSTSVKWGRWKEAYRSSEMTGQWLAHRRCQVAVSLRPPPASVPGGRGLGSAALRGARGTLRKPLLDAQGFEGTEDVRKVAWEQCAPGRVPGGGCQRQAPQVRRWGAACATCGRQDRGPSPPWQSVVFWLSPSFLRCITKNLNQH